jgi:CBS domain-containing membrane protein
MHEDVVTATPASSVRRAASLMRRRGIGCLPVVERDRLVGIVTVSQLLAVLERALGET